MGILFDTVSKAAIGIFMALRSMGAALRQNMLDAVILRVWMQWAAISNALSGLDFSLVEIF